MINDCKIEFPLSGTVTIQDVRRAQERLLKMAIIVRDCLEQNSIQYFMRAGTLLGAIRHNGFVPWDLDFDIAVMEEDYNKAMKAINQGIPDWLIVQDQDSDPYYCAFWSKVVDKNTEITSTEYESDNKFMYKGLHVDIYKIKRTSPSSYRRDLLTDNLVYYELKYQRGLINKQDYDMHITEIKSSLLELPTSVSEELTECYFLHFMHTDLKNVFPLKRYSFENELFLGPNDYNQILKERYGKYNVLPEYKKRDMKISKIKFLA